MNLSYTAWCYFHLPKVNEILFKHIFHLSSSKKPEWVWLAVCSASYTKAHLNRLMQSWGWWIMLLQHMYVHGSGNKRRIMPLVVLLQAVCLKDLPSQFVWRTVGLEGVDASWKEATVLFIFLITSVELDTQWDSWSLLQTDLNTYFLLTCSHPSSCCSVAEIMSVLFFHTMKYRPEDPRNASNDRFVLSKVAPVTLQLSGGFSAQPLWPLTLLSVPLSGSRRPGAVRRVGRDGLPEGKRAPQSP